MQLILTYFAIYCQLDCVLYLFLLRSIINKKGIRMEIIAKIDKLKNERGWTDYELAGQAMITQSTIASMKARNSPPKLDTLQAICNAFGITLAQFFLEDEKIEVLSEQEKILLENFRKLPPKKQKALIDLL